MFSTFNNVFSVIMVFGFVFSAGVFAFILLNIFSPNFRSKVMKHQLNMQKRIISDNKQSLSDIQQLSSDVQIDAVKNTLENHKDDLSGILKNNLNMTMEAVNQFQAQNSDVLHEMSTRSAEIQKDGIRMMAEAVTEGVNDGRRKIFCKHCGKEIDEDSTFCKFCGKEQ